MPLDHTIESFIKTVLLKDVRRMTYECGLHYLAFGTIAVGIEFLGACEDLLPFGEPRQSAARFKAGIDAYMAPLDVRYSTFNNPANPFYLYKHLRCGMAHIMRPQGAVGFVSREGATKTGHTHLSTVNGGAALLMIAEDFYDHFEQACNALLANLSSKTDSKFRTVYLPVSELAPLTTGSVTTSTLSGA